MFLEHVQGVGTARDAWLKARDKERLKRNSHLSDLATKWTSGRRDKGESALPYPHIKGRFHGGAVVMATSAEIDEEDLISKTAEGRLDLTREL